MCYLTLLSTSSDADLTVRNNELVQFSKSLPGIEEEKYLEYPFKWYLGSKTGCSCEFRRLCTQSVSLGFGDPEEWFPEEPDQIVATRHIASVIRSMVASGARVDCVDAWAHDPKVADPLAGQIEVDLSEISDTQFRFFERHRFDFVART